LASGSLAVWLGQMHFLTEQVTTQARRWQVTVAIIAVAAGLLDIWLLLGFRELNPANLSWLSGDPADYQIGWEFIRAGNIWHFPFTWIPRLDYPTGLSAAYLDPVPLAALVFRLLSPLLPAQFQYLGIYAAICFCLQAWFGLRLTALFAKNDLVVTLLGGAFFLLSPVLTKEAYGHFALLSQWLILASLYYYFRISGDRSLRADLLPSVVLCAIAAGIQPYFALMTNVIGAAGVFHAWNIRRTKSAALSSAAWLLAQAAATLLSLMFFGFFVPGKTHFVGEGYSLYSMNLLAPINPQSPGALNPFSFPVVHGWTLAGYDYLGLGVLLLLFVAIACAPRLLRELASRMILPLVVISILFTLLALSTEVSFADHVLFRIPAPQSVIDILSWFRGSGRLFWPVHALLMLGAIAGLCAAVPSRWLCRLVLAIALVIQYFDIVSVRQGVAVAAAAEHADPLRSPVWSGLPAHFHHLVIFPAWQCAGFLPGGMGAQAHLSHIAAESGMTLNSVYVSRQSALTHKLDCVTMPAMVRRNGFAPDTAYVLANPSLAKNRFPHACKHVDGLDLCWRLPPGSP
jgi:hypothetical protein